MVVETGVLLDALMASTPTTMAAAHAAASTGEGGRGGGLKRASPPPQQGTGFSQFSKAVEFGRKALAMQECSAEHTLDLLTFVPGPGGE